MLINAERSCLLGVDLQERLMAVVHEPDSVIAHCAWLMQIAQRLHVPTLLSEQYPKGLGRTVAALRELAPASAIMEKRRFSCAAESACLDRIDHIRRDQIILMGVEAHVCVLQSALGLLEYGKKVYVVAECIASRDPRNVKLAIERMRAEGVQIVSREMVVFEWLFQAGTEQFREINREFLK